MAAGATIAAGQAVSQSIASPMLAKPQVSRQEMITTLSQTVLLVFTGMHGTHPFPFTPIMKTIGISTTANQ